MLAVSGGDNKVSLWKESLAGDEWICISEGSNKAGQQQQQQQAAAGQQQQQPVQG